MPFDYDVESRARQGFNLGSRRNTFVVGGGGVVFVVVVNVVVGGGSGGSGGGGGSDGGVSFCQSFNLLYHTISLVAILCAKYKLQICVVLPC